MPTTNLKYQDIQKIYSDEIAEIMAKLAKGKSVEKGSLPKDMNWEFTWVEAIGFIPPDSWYNKLSQKEKDDIKNGLAKGEHTPKGVAGICLHASKGRWRCEVPITSVVIPDEIHDFFMPKPKTTGPKGMTLEIIQNGKKDEEIIVGGYQKDGLTFLLTEDHFLYFIDKGKVLIAGGLMPTAKKNFDACPEGGIFMYRNKKLYRMTKEEIKAILKKNPFNFGGIHFS